jgi:chaperonin GroEL
MNELRQPESPTKNKELKFGSESREEIMKGVDLIANAVKATLGPRGRNVVIEQSKTTGLMQNYVGLMPRITKDGVSVAKEINVDDKFQNLGVQIVKEVATRQNEMAGDGTTTATVLAQAIARDAMQCINNGINPVTLKREMDETVKEAIEYISLNAIDVKDTESLKNIATISANGDTEVGNIVSKAVEEVGPHGIISVEPAPLDEMTLDIVEGMEFPAGFASNHFITHPDKGIADLTDCNILFYDAKINDIKEILPVVNLCHEAGKALIVICPDIASDVLSTLVLNKVRNGLKIAVLKLPDFLPSRADMMEDLAIVTGGIVINAESGLGIGSVTQEHLGYCKRVRVGQELSEFIDGDKDAEKLETRIAHLKSLVEETKKTDSKYTLLEGRLAKLSGGIAVIRVGGSSEIDIGERKDRIEDAINATKAAVEEGIVAGGGTMLLRVSEYLSRNSGTSKGADLIIKALQSPFYTILANAGVDEEEAKSIMLQVLKTKDEGFDVDKNEFCNLIKQGVIDPAKVVKNALKDAANVVGLLITTEVSIVNTEKGLE